MWTCWQPARFAPMKAVTGKYLVEYARLFFRKAIEVVYVRLEPSWNDSGLSRIFGLLALPGARYVWVRGLLITVVTSNGRGDVMLDGISVTVVRFVGISGTTTTAASRRRMLVLGATVLLFIDAASHGQLLVCDRVRCSITRRLFFGPEDACQSS